MSEKSSVCDRLRSILSILKWLEDNAPHPSVSVAKEKLGDIIKDLCKPDTKALETCLRNCVAGEEWDLGDVAECIEVCLYGSEG